jgi:hypothetical protein
MPTHLDRITLSALEEQRREQAERVRQETFAKYQDPSLEFKLSETKGGRDIEVVKREIEEKFAAELKFDSSFVNPAPDFDRIPAKVKLNAAAILREDALFKKQQEKDFQLLQNYEEELRDCTEYYAWQNKMRERDREVKLQGVIMRRELAKQSAEQAKDAINRQRENNQEVAGLLRQQAEAIAKQKQMEDEIRILSNQEVVNEIIAVREVAPKLAKEKVLGERVENGKKLREELEELRLKKIEEDRLEEEVRADHIRQLRALESVTKKHRVVFDPTETPGQGLMSEMSYMEMKERYDMELIRQEAAEFEKRKAILAAKEKKAEDLDNKVQMIAKYRKIKADSNRSAHQRRKEQEVREKELEERKREEAAIALNRELQEKREEKKRVAEALAAEEERIRRQQQYLGAAKGMVDETKARQLLEGQEREIKLRQSSAKEVAVAEQVAKEHDRANRKDMQKRALVAKLREEHAKSDEALVDRREAIEKMKEEIFRKKQLVKKGHAQHEKTHEVVEKHNLYASRITKDAQLRRTRTNSASPS